MRKTTRRRSAAPVLAAAVCAAMVLGACGGDDETSEDTDAPATDAGAAATDAPGTTMAPQTTMAAATTMAPESTMGAETTMAPASSMGAETTMPAGSSMAPDTAGGGVGASGEGFCGGYVGLTMAFSSDAPPSPDELTALIDETEADAPEEVADELGVMLDAARSVIESEFSDFSAFEAPEFSEAQSVVDPYAFENCDFDNKVEVTAIDYGYEGLPTELTAGQTAILMTNDGVEAHEIVFLRKNDGVTQTFAELLELPEEEAQEFVTEAGGAFAPTTGASGLGVVDLEPGDYIAICFIPVGTMIEGAEFTEGTGPPHFVEGMQVEFTVG